MLYRAILFALLFFCCAPAQYPHPPKKVIFVDTSALEGVQKKAAEEAMGSWARQTHGCVVILEGKGGPRLIHMTPPEKYDTDDGRYVIGMCLPGLGDCRTIELAFSRIPSYDFAVLVIAHELGHAIGLDHVCRGQDCGVSHSLMSSGIDKAWLRLSDEDKAELEKATGCALP